jgi:hypothetical protein
MYRNFPRNQSAARVVFLPGWVLGLVAVGVAALGFCVLLIGAAFLLLVAPLALGALLFARWRLRKFLREAAGHSRANVSGARNPRVIDADYRVLRDDELRR